MFVSIWQIKHWLRNHRYWGMKTPVLSRSEITNPNMSYQPSAGI